MEIQLASPEDLAPIAGLFDQYRSFYGQPSDLAAAQRFIQARLESGDSAIFWAHQSDQAAGFTQLYPSFSSVSMRPIWILNDLFVAERYRQQGIATQLMEAAETFARDTGAVRLALATQIANRPAQALYEARGYRRDEAFYHYSLAL